MTQNRRPQKMYKLYDEDIEKINLYVKEYSMIQLAKKIGTTPITIKKAMTTGASLRIVSNIRLFLHIWYYRWSDK